jgi:BMFP domain-containing protein YqiC
MQCGTMSSAKTKLIDDLASVLGGASATAQALRDEIEHVLRARIDKILSEHGVVTRDEFEALRDVVMQMREDKDV